MGREDFHWLRILLISSFGVQRVQRLGDESLHMSDESLHMSDDSSLPAVMREVVFQRFWAG